MVFISNQFLSKFLHTSFTLLLMKQIFNFESQKIEYRNLRALERLPDLKQAFPEGIILTHLPLQTRYKLRLALAQKNFPEESGYFVMMALRLFQAEFRACITAEIIVTIRIHSLRIAVQKVITVAIQPIWKNCEAVP